jgi:hypothetical protein
MSPEWTQKTLAEREGFDICQKRQPFDIQPYSSYHMQMQLFAIIFCNNPVLLYFLLLPVFLHKLVSLGSHKSVCAKVGTEWVGYRFGEKPFFLWLLAGSNYKRAN